MARLSRNRTQPTFGTPTSAQRRLSRRTRPAGPPCRPTARRWGPASRPFAARNRASRRFYDDGPARDDGKWRREAEWMAVQLRKAWERAVETHLLNEAVQRHSRSVQTQRVS